MTKVFSFLILLNLLLIPALMVNGRSESAVQNDSAIKDGEYIAVIEGYDWGAAVSKVILLSDETISSVSKDEFSIQVEKSSDCGEIPEDMANGDRFISDEEKALLPQKAAQVSIHCFP